jgi:hypothetical protein
LEALRKEVDFLRSLFPKKKRQLQGIVACFTRTIDEQRLFGLQQGSEFVVGLAARRIWKRDGARQVLGIEVGQRTRVKDKNSSRENHVLRLLKGNELDTGNSSLCEWRLGMILNPWNRNGPDKLSQGAEKKRKKENTGQGSRR